MVELGGGTDHRRRILEGLEVYTRRSGEDADPHLARFFEAMTKATYARARRARRSAGASSRSGAAPRAWSGSTSTQLCVKPRSQVDYLEIASGYHTVLVSGVPQLQAATDRRDPPLHLAGRRLLRPARAAGDLRRSAARGPRRACDRRRRPRSAWCARSSRAPRAGCARCSRRITSRASTRRRTIRRYAASTGRKPWLTESTRSSMFKAIYLTQERRPVQGARDAELDEGSAARGRRHAARRVLDDQLQGRARDRQHGRRSCASGRWWRASTAPARWRHSSHPAWKPGDRSSSTAGAWARRTGAASRRRRGSRATGWCALPAALTTRQAMAIGTAGYTAMLCGLALERHGVTKEQGEVLVTGATGGRGQHRDRDPRRLGLPRRRLDRARRGGRVPEVAGRGGGDRPRRAFAARQAAAEGALGGRRRLGRQPHARQRLRAVEVPRAWSPPAASRRAWTFRRRVAPFILRGVTLARHRQRERAILRREACSCRLGAPRARAGAARALEIHGARRSALGDERSRARPTVHRREGPRPAGRSDVNRIDEGPMTISRRP